MPKTKTAYRCTECGAEHTRWQGRCDACGEWNTLVEEIVAPKVAANSSARRLGGSRALASGGAVATPTRLRDVRGSSAERWKTGLDEFDFVLGGGIVPGSMILVGGEPGIGKSTLLLQAARALASAGEKILYVSGEESLGQVRLRAGRLGAIAERLYVLGETDPEVAAEEAGALAPAAVVVDSVQSMTSPAVPSPAGSVAQVRNAALVFQRFARDRGVPVVLIGHVTKDGTLAGPKALEHLVDTVLSFEGDRSRGRRVLRAWKNRFGPVEEIALYEMTAAGLSEIADPSRALLAERRAGMPGSAVSASVEGTRPLLVEVQALVGPEVPGSARRSSVGIDGGRLAMVLAVLEACAAAPVASREVFVSCAGGIDVREPAVDLALAAAILSSLRRTPLPADAFYFGEIGLLGEVRAVPDASARLREGAAHGFRTVCLPRSDAACGAEFPDMRVVPITDVRDLSRAGS